MAAPRSPSDWHQPHLISHFLLISLTRLVPSCGTPPVKWKKHSSDDLWSRWWPLMMQSTTCA
ncbi:hypothetical protein CGRA01v4_14791 [Colletotrichum graminicola]|nr:hypothetical protein CGRA01v4_14791 [Colletotrichum graminicola]